MEMQKLKWKYTQDQLRHKEEAVFIVRLLIVKIKRAQPWAAEEDGATILKEFMADCSITTVHTLYGICTDTDIHYKSTHMI